MFPSLSLVILHGSSMHNVPDNIRSKTIAGVILNLRKYLVVNSFVQPATVDMLDEYNIT